MEAASFYIAFPFNFPLNFAVGVYFLFFSFVAEAIVLFLVFPCFFYFIFIICVFIMCIVSLCYNNISILCEVDRLKLLLGWKRNILCIAPVYKYAHICVDGVTKEESDTKY